MNRLLYLSADPGVPVLGHKGASVHVRALVDALLAAGTEIVVASPRIDFEGEVIAKAAELVEIDPVLPRELATETQLCAAIQRQAEQIQDVASSYSVDAVYERFSLFSNGGVRAAAVLGVPHVLEVNAPLRAEAVRFRTLPHPALAEVIEEEVFGRTERVFAVSRTLAELLQAAGVPRTKIEVLGNGIDVEAFASLPPVRGEAFTVGFAGSLKPWHGIDVLLEGFALALARVPALRLEVVGAGPLSDLVAGSRLPPARLVHRGQVSHREAIGAMASWDVGAAPYPALEDFYFSPLKVVEYMAAGTCPVVSDLPVLREMLGDGERGVLVAPGRADAFAASLVELAGDRSRAAELGARARAYALTQLGWGHNAARVLEALDAVPVGVR